MGKLKTHSPTDIQSCVYNEHTDVGISCREIASYFVFVFSNYHVLVYCVNKYHTVLCLYLFVMIVFIY